MKKITTKLPEILLIVGVAFYWLETSIFLNPIAIGLMLFLSLTLITKNKIIKTLTSITFALLSIYMIFAVISEYQEFEIGNVEGFKPIIVGLSIFITSLILSVIMGIKGLLIEDK